MRYIATQFGMLAAIALSSVSVFGQTAAKPACLNRIGQPQWNILLSDLDAEKKKSLQDATARKAQVDNLKQLLALACEAVRLGLASEKTSATEMAFIRSETIAHEYDKKKTRQTNAEPFSWITAVQVTAFYKVPKNVTDFDRFFQTKREILERANVPGIDAQASEAEIKPAKDFYARMKIAESAAAGMTVSERTATEFKARIQQAQFLARLTADHIAPEVAVTPVEVERYIATKPEFDVAGKRAEAVRLRDRAKAGEDFAALANEFSEDPGNTESNGKKNGGLYANVPRGMMVPPFETASLALRPGEISDVVETDFGFHIIKLERKSADGSLYDVRHILVATMYDNPDDPDGRPVPAAVYVRTKLEVEKEAAVMKRIVAANPVVVEDPRLSPTPAPRPVTTNRRVTKRR